MSQLRSLRIDRDAPPNEFIRGPKWRTRTSPRRRRRAVILSFVAIVALGLAVATAVSLAVVRLGGPGWAVAGLWLLPAAATVAWTVRSPGPAILGDDDDHGWGGYATRWVLVGEGDRRRSLPARIVLAVVFGAPIVWSFLVLMLLEVTGIL